MKKYVHVYLTLTDSKKVGQEWFDTKPADLASPLRKMLGSAAVHDRTLKIVVRQLQLPLSSLQSRCLRPGAVGIREPSPAAAWREADQRTSG